jgi:hypothetical protein
MKKIRKLFLLKNILCFNIGDFENYTLIFIIKF